MKIALIVLLLVTSLALNAQTLQGGGVRVADGDMLVDNGNTKLTKGLECAVEVVTQLK